MSLIHIYTHTFDIFWCLHGITFHTDFYFFCNNNMSHASFLSFFKFVYRVLLPFTNINDRLRLYFVFKRSAQPRIWSPVIIVWKICWDQGYYVTVTWCRRDSYVIPTFSLVIHGAIVGCPSNTVPKQSRLQDNLLKAFCIRAGMRKQSEKSITEVTQWPTLGPKQTSFTMSKEWSALGGTLHLR